MHILVSVLLMFSGGLCFGASANLLCRSLWTKLIYGTVIMYGYVHLLPPNATNTDLYVVWFGVGFMLSVWTRWFEATETESSEAKDELRRA